MKKSFQLGGVAALTLLGSLATSQAQTATTDPVGYVTITINGHNNEVSQGLTIASLSLVGSTEYSSNVSSFATGSNNTLTDTSATFAAGEFLNSGEISHYIEITSGEHSGTITWITGSPGGSSLYTLDDLSHIAPNSSYSIKTAHTVASLFGSPSVLAGSSSQANADEILILNASTGVYTSFWYKNAGLGGTGWQSTDSNILNPESYALFPTDGLLILRKQADDTSITLTGAVKQDETNVLIEGSGYNLLSTLIPIEQLTPANCGLYTEDSTTGLAASSSLANADEIVIYNPTTKSFTSFWYKDAGLGGTGWQSTDSSIIDVANYQFPSNSALLVYRKQPDAFTWNMPSVTTN
ncbi:hypothetical protein ACFPK9_13010 [Rubritalea spongiae]|uniref:TIGR02597 family protein n=1 Tax=Rubritalea spongiae TaxID=430797 RepID=A0ABW5E2C1_9BACT